MDSSTSSSPRPDSPLTTALKVVYAERGYDYGSPLENHSRTARLWSLFLGIDVSARDVCMLNILQKISRDQHAPKLDNLVDIAGYAENAFLIEHPSILPTSETSAFFNSTPAINLTTMSSTPAINLTTMSIGRGTSENPGC